MDTTQDGVIWLRERVCHSAVNLVRALNNEMASELKGLPVPLVQHVHNCAIFEILSAVNTHLPIPVLLDTSQKEFLEFVAQERSVFLELCHRLAQWQPHETQHDSTHEGSASLRRDSPLH